MDLPISVLAAAVVSATAAACAGPAIAARGRSTTDLDCHDQLGCLPGLPAGEVADAVHRAWGIAHPPVGMPTPPLAQELTALDLEEYWEMLGDWIERRTEGIEAARLELEEATFTDPRIQVVAAAAVGMMYEDAAHALEELVPGPRVGDEAVDPDGFRRGVAGRARPLTQRAREAYQRCARTGEMPQLGALCAARRARLDAIGPVPPSAPIITARAGQSVVQVVRR